MRYLYMTNLACLRSFKYSRNTGCVYTQRLHKDQEIIVQVTTCVARLITFDQYNSNVKIN